ncbi:MAG: hypothetical protein QOI80_75 [Solirubrobacteraceae bacterium]|nr:hypothetical protein [Solirubrobacteraceae bacterium]
MRTMPHPAVLALTAALALVAALPSAASARNSFTLDTSPDGFAALAVDAAGTGYFAWERAVSPSDDATVFCKVARGATCTSPVVLPTPPLNPPPHDSTLVSAAFPVLGAGSTVYVVGPRYVAADVVVWTSTDGGASFGPAEQVAQSGAYLGSNPTDVLATGSSFAISSHNPGLNFTSVPASGAGPATGADLTPPDGSTNITGSALGLAGGNPVDAFSRANGAQPQTIDVTGYSGSGDPNASANWSAPSQVTAGTLPSLAGGPSGLFLASQDLTGDVYGPVHVRKYAADGSFGPPVTVQSDTSGDNAGRISQTPTSGQLLVAWQGATLADGGTGVRLYRSTDAGGSFARVGDIGEGAPNYAIGPDSIRLAAADDGQGFATFIDYGGGKSNLRVADFSPIAELTLRPTAVQANTFVLKVPAGVSGPGTVSGMAVVPAAQAARARKCKPHFVLRHGKCVSTIYGTGSVHARAAGTVTLKIKPSRATLKSLHNGKRLRVTLTVTFRPSGGGKAVTSSEHATVRGKKK